MRPQANFEEPNIKRLSLLASFAFLLGSGVGCNDNDSDKVVVDPAPPSPTLTDPVLSNPAVELKLVGNTFSTPCFPANFLDITSSNSVATFKEAGEFSKSYQFFLGSSCGIEPYLSLETSGTFADQGPAAGEQPVSNIDFIIKDAVIAIHNQSMLTTFNVNAYCGKSDWKLEEKVSLRDVNCDFFQTTFDTPVNDVYTIEERVLFFGNSLTYDIQPGIARPSGVDRDISYRVQTN